jgi:hypothetical protein
MVENKLPGPSRRRSKDYDAENDFILRRCFTQRTAKNVSRKEPQRKIIAENRRVK